MKTGRTVGVVALAAVGIGALVTGWLPNFHFGTGDGTGSGTQTDSTQLLAPDVSQTNRSVPEQDGDPAPVAVSTLATPETGVPDVESPPVDVVYVLIDGRNYLFRRGSESRSPYEAADLEQIAAAAQAATGDDNGVRIRISQKSSSRELTERALRTKLDEAGIPREAVRWKDEPVDATE